jgi:hypothetical protein
MARGAYDEYHQLRYEFISIYYRGLSPFPRREQLCCKPIVQTNSSNPEIPRSMMRVIIRYPSLVTPRHAVFTNIALQIVHLQGCCPIHPSLYLFHCDVYPRFSPPPQQLHTVTLYKATAEQIHWRIGLYVTAAIRATRGGPCSCNAHPLL